MPSGLAIAYSGQSQSTHSINFKTTRVVRYSYRLTALAEGTWTLGPVELEVDGQSLRAPAVEVRVRARDAADVASRDVVGTLSDSEPYLGEVVVYAFTFRYRGKVYDARWTPPSLDGFVEEAVADAVQVEGTTELDGVSWNVQQITLPLVAAGSGPRTLPPALLTVQVPADRKQRGRRDTRPFGASPFNRYDMRTETLATRPVDLVVKPLPTEGRPREFSGLVGRFQLDARVVEAAGAAASVADGGAVEVPLGESVTVELTLSGDGTLSGFRLPSPPDGSGYRAYDDAPEVVARVEDGEFRTVAVFRRALVPEAEGLIEVPPVSLSVFDPHQGAYVDVESEALRISVVPGEAGAGEVASFASGERDRREDVVALGEDILPVPGDVSVGDTTLGAVLPLAVGLPAVPALVLVGAWAAGRARSRAPDPRAALRARLAAVPGRGSGQDAARLAALEGCFREAAGLRLGCPAPAVDRAALTPLGPGAVALYVALERARYGGLAALDAAAPGGGTIDEALRRFVEET